MLIYFDESYDSNAQKWLILGTLYNPNPRALHNKMDGIRATTPFKSKTGRIIEEKYHNCFSEYNHYAATKLIDAFFECPSFFRAIAVDLRVSDLSRFGKPEEAKALKEARRYKKFAELLIRNNTSAISYATLLVDEVVRCSGDLFVEKMKEEFTYGVDPPILHFIDEVKSNDPQYQVLRICDLLTGCVLNNLIPTRCDWKNKTRDYLCRKMGVSSLTPISLPKFNVWLWTPQS